MGHTGAQGQRSSKIRHAQGLKISNVVKLKPTKKESLARSISVLNVAYDNVLVKGCNANYFSLVKWSDSSHLSLLIVFLIRNSVTPQVHLKKSNLVDNFDGDRLKIACSLADLR